MALTDTKVRSAKPQEKEYTLVDGDGMFLLVHPNNRALMGLLKLYGFRDVSKVISRTLSK